VSEDGCTGTPTYSSNTTAPNILLIMVDQMRAPRWLPSSFGDPWDASPDGWAGFTATYLPEINFLYSHSLVFPNYFPAATRCSPSRASLLTGLYPQQTCIFRTLNISDGVASPSLIPYAQDGFPTIGDVLSQTLFGNSDSSVPYTPTWIGKWHVSDPPGGGTVPGSNGPQDYGFDSTYSIPRPTNGVYPLPSTGCPSPDGVENEGNAGYFLDDTSLQTVQPAYASASPTFPTGGPSAPTPVPGELSDTAIVDAFLNYWLIQNEGAGPTTPWFAALSLVNPHDITDFPFSFALADGTVFGIPTSINPHTGFLPPPTAGYTCAYPGCAADQLEAISIPELNPTGTPPYIPTMTTDMPASWNYDDNPAAQPYATYNATTDQYGKPGLQTYYQTQVNAGTGSVLGAPTAYPPTTTPPTTGWAKFLNYYFWLQYCADGHIKQVQQAVDAAFTSDTWIIFTADHGDYGGSHWLRAKGGALYDEVINTPLYISASAMRSNASMTAPIVRNFVCSSVDILPFIYSLALGNESWRTYSCDIINYLSGRESILDAIFNGKAATQRRIAYNGSTGILNSQQNAYNGQYYQPYILHTTDEYSSATVGEAAVPPHALAFRTVDITVTTGDDDYTAPYGGRKLGIYNWWNAQYSCSTSGNPTQPPTPSSTSPYNYPQYEFYTYPDNAAEVGNQGPTSVNATTGETSLGLSTSTANLYLTILNDLIDNELYQVYPQFGPTSDGGNGAYATALANYMTFLSDTDGCGS
jgi:uncharacterized sulfatase